MDRLRSKTIFQKISDGCHVGFLKDLLQEETRIVSASKEGIVKTVG